MLSILMQNNLYNYTQAVTYYTYSIHYRNTKTFQRVPHNPCHIIFAQEYHWTTCISGTLYEIINRTLLCACCVAKRTTPSGPSGFTSKLISVLNLKGTVKLDFRFFYDGYQLRGMFLEYGISTRISDGLRSKMKILPTW